MKKRLLISLVLIFLLLCLIFLGYLFRFPFKKQVLYKDLPAMMPANPLVYVQCRQLQSHLPQLSESERYRDFLRSPFVEQIKKTEWWNEFSEGFQEFLDGMIIDYRRVFGTDLALGIYKAEEGEMFPGVILVSRIDRLAGSAERLLYLFDRVSGQIGTGFAQEIEGVPVYVVTRQDLLLPLYYCVVDDLGMISNSFPLLKNTILQALGVTKETGEFAPFRKIIHDIPNTRFVTGYVHPELLMSEFRDNQVLQSLRFFDSRSLDAASKYPFITLALDVYSDHPSIIRADLISQSTVESEKPNGESVPETGTLETDQHPGQADQDDILRFPEELSGTFPLIGVLHTNHFSEFTQTLDTLFPSQPLRNRSGQEWSQQFPWTNPPQGTFGRMLECRLSGKLFGTLYTIPDISCVLDVVDSDRALRFLDTQVDIASDQFFSSMGQRALVKKISAMYQNTNVTSVSVLLQDMFCYTILPVKGNSESSYALAATSQEVLKKRVDKFLAYPIHPPYTLKIPQSIQSEDTQKSMAPQHEVPVALFLLNNELFSEWLAAVSRTTTFSLLFPRQTHQQLYHVLPDLIIFLKSLPPLALEVSMQKNQRLFLTIQIPKENPKFEARNSKQIQITKKQNSKP